MKKKNKKENNGMYPSKVLQMQFHSPVQLAASHCEWAIPFVEWIKNREKVLVKKKKG